MKNSFLIYYEYKDILEDLTNEEVGILFRALFDYEIKEVEPQFIGLMKMAFRVIKGNLDRDKNKYDKRCETSAQNGRLGGRPKKPTENLKKPNSKPKKPKKADNDNVTDTENDNDDDNVTDTDAETENGTSTNLSVAEENETNADLFSFDDKEAKSSDLFSFIEEAFGRTLNSIEYELIRTWEDNDLTRYAVKESILNGARGIRYIETVLSSWKGNGFKTVQDVQAYQEKYKKSKSKEQHITELPEWYGKDLTNEEMTKEEKAEMEDILNSF